MVENMAIGYRIQWSETSINTFDTWLPLLIYIKGFNSYFMWIEEEGNWVDF